MRSLTYYLTQNPIKRSFDPKDADYSANAIHMRQLVGTLIKFNSVNTFVPRIAESWSTDANEKVWTFQLRKGLTCEDGTDLNAENYKTGLQLAFRNHSPEKSTPAFSKLVGWTDFLDGSQKSIRGIETPSDHTLVFRFESPPSGLESYLSMPYFGFYCKSNFDTNGKWKNPNSIISSGPYRLLSFDEKKDVIKIKLRDDWGIQPNDHAPEIVVLEVTSRDQILKSYKPHSIVEAALSESDKFDESWRVMKGAVTVSSNLILNPNREAFKKLSARQEFARKIRQATSSKMNRLQWAQISNKFYPFASNASSPMTTVESNQVPALSIKSLSVEGVEATNERIVLMKEIVAEATKSLGIAMIEIPFYQDRLPIETYDKRRSSETDLYFIYVDKGGAAEPWAIRMMFCSKLGVRFPDPSGRICKLVDKYEGRQLSTLEFSIFGDEFEKIVQEDSAVIPLIHRGKNYLLSTDIDASQLTSNLMSIDFQLIKIK